jgi:hypothetical protein
MTLQQEKADSSRGSSEVDEPPLELTTEVLQEYSHSQIVNNFLNVLVTRKYLDGKNRYEVSRVFFLLVHRFSLSLFQTSITLLPFSDIELAVKNGYDGQQYEADRLNCSPILLLHVFDPYRQMKHRLEEAGIFTKDQKEKALLYSQDDNKAYRGYLLDAEFPLTYSKSAFGIGLNEEQLQTRFVCCVLVSSFFL